MDVDKVLKLLVSEFKYRTDKDKYGFVDVWRVMDEDVEGDCEDFALTLIYRLAKENPLKMAWWMLTGRAAIYYYKHKEKGTGHAGVRFDGRYTDNITKVWNDGSLLETKYGYKKVMRWFAPLTLVKIIGTNIIALLLKPFR